MVYFIKVTKSGNGILVGEKKLSTKVVTINGVDKEIRTQGGKLGFIAVTNAADWNLEPGDAMAAFSVTDKPVLDQDKKPLNNVFWCDVDAK